MQALRDRSLPFFEAQYGDTGTDSSIPNTHLELLHSVADIDCSQILSHELFVFRGVKYRMYQSFDNIGNIGNSPVVLGNSVQASWAPCRIEAIYKISLKTLSKSLT